MNFGAAIAEVITLTKRPDKQAETKAAINAAIFWYSNTHDWPQSLVELTHPAPSTDQYVNNLDLTNPLYFTRFKKMVYIRPEGQRFYIKKWPPDKVITEKGCELTNVWYRSGSTIIYSISILNSPLKIGYQQYPVALVGSSDTYWMLDEMPFVIIYRAASEVFDSAGNKEESDRYAKLAMQLFTAFRDAMMGLG